MSVSCSNTKPVICLSVCVSVCSDLQSAAVFGPHLLTRPDLGALLGGSVLRTGRGWRGAGGGGFELSVGI